ncbi:MAG: hypothetical protein QXS50_04735 [Candidatus Caldarchaeum sp.]
MNSPILFFSGRYRRKGLSEVVAAVALTLAALVAMAVAYTVGALRTAPAASSTGLLVSAHLEPFGDGGVLTITVYNVGKEPVNLQSVRLLSGSNTVFQRALNQQLKPSTSFSDTYLVSGVSSGGVYMVEARAQTLRSNPTTVIGSVEVSMR